MLIGRYSIYELTINWLQKPTPLFFPQTVCPHWVRIRWLLWNIEVHFDCAGSHKVWSSVLGPSIIPVNFCKKWLLWHVEVYFDCAGSHKVWSSVLGPSIFPVNFRKSGCCEMLKCISTSQACTKCGPSFWAQAFPVNFRTKLLLWNVEVHFDCADSSKVWS